MTRVPAITVIVFVLASPAFSSEIPTSKQYTNSLGMEFVQIQPGTFVMGTDPNFPIPDGAAEYSAPPRVDPEKMYVPAVWQGMRQGLTGLFYGDPGDRPTDPDDSRFLVKADFDIGRDPTTWEKQWRGYIKAPATGTVTFSAEIADTADLRFTINGNGVVEIPRNKQTGSGDFSMITGKLYPISLRLSNYDGNCFMHLYWNLPGGAKTPVPADALCYNAADYNLNMLKLAVRPGWAQRCR